MLSLLIKSHDFNFDSKSAMQLGIQNSNKMFCLITKLEVPDIELSYCITLKLWKVTYLICNNISISPSGSVKMKSLTGKTLKMNGMRSV